MQIPLVDLHAQWRALQPQVMAAIEDVLTHMQLFLGPQSQAFEQEFATYCGCDYGVGCATGTDALMLALRACEISDGDEVITVSNTFIATFEAIALVGATPVFVDIDPETYTMDWTQLERVLTPRTRAILPVHLYGHPVEMQPLLDFARVHGLWVIEDASQAHGATYHGQRVGSMGDIGCFSLYYSKNLGAYGEAGIWVIGDKKLAEAVSMLRDHGSRVRYRHEMLGTNARLDEMQAAVLRVKLPHLEEWNAARQAHAQVYTEQLQGVVGTLPVVRAGNTHVFYVYVVQVQEREQFRQALGQAGIATGVHYPIPVHLQPACAHFGYSRGMLPVTEAVAERIVSLPMYPELTAEQIQAGDLGKIYCVEAERVNLGLYRSDINVIWDLAPHDISILLYLFGQEVEQINVQAHTHLQTGIHDIAHLDLTYVDGMTARIHVSWLHPCKIRRVTVIGDARMVVYDDTNPAEMIKIYNKGADVDVDPVVSYRFGAITIPHIDWMEPMHLECEDFVNAIRTKEEPHSNGKFGLEVVRILAAAQEVQQAQEEQQALVRTLQRLSDKASS